MAEWILDHLEEMIAEHGQAVLGIFADTARGLPAINYSIGLQDLGLPEIVVTGVHSNSAVPIINEIAGWLKLKGSAPADRELLPDGLLSHPARFRELSAAEIEHNLCFAVHRSDQIGRDPPQAFQIIYQDPDGRWPEDPGYSCGLALLLAQGEKETRQ